MSTAQAYPLRDIQPGRVLVHDSQLYVALTRPASASCEPPSHFRSQNLSDSDFIRTLSFPDSQGNRRQVRVLPVDRIEELDLLRELDDAVAIRFRGDYVTKKYPHSTFKGPERRKIRSRDGTLIGIYNEAEKSFLKGPEPRRGDWKNSIIHLDDSPRVTPSGSGKQNAMGSFLGILAETFRRGLRLSPIG